MKDIVEECRLGWLEGIGQSECGQFVTGKLKVKITPNMKVMRKYKDRLEGRVVGDMVMVDSLLGGRRVTEKMKQTIRSKLEMLKRSRSLTNGDDSHTVEKAVTENDVPNSVTAQARILEKLRLSRQETPGVGGVTATDMATSVREKLEVARKQFKEMNGQGDKDINGEGMEDTAVG